MRRRALAIATVTLVLSLVLPAAGAGHAEGMDLVLTGQAHPEHGASPIPGQGVLTQVTNEHPNQTLTEQVVLGTDCRLWVSEQASQVTLHFASQAVVYELDLVGEEAPQSLNVTVGTYNSSGGFVGVGTDTVTGSSLLGTVHGEITTGAFTVEKGEFLATRVCVSAVNPGLVAVDTAGGDSQVTYTAGEDSGPYV